MAVPAGLGGGEEMGGVRVVKHYMQRVAIQGSPSTISAITKIFQQNAKGNTANHPPLQEIFSKSWKLGDQLITEKRLITSEDIDRSPILSGDHFYAHEKDTDFKEPCSKNRWLMAILF